MQFSRLLICLLGFVAASAQAQLRTIPKEAKAGEVRRVVDALVLTNGVQVPLAPGVQIRDQENRILVPNALPPGSQVRYLLDEAGMVRQVWILTPEEAKKGAANN